MTAESAKYADQARWNHYGLRRTGEIESSPHKYIIADSPVRHSAAYGQLMGLLEPLEGKRILELGCGLGELSVWLAKRGARVTAVDLGPDLVVAARVLAKVNGVDCEFRVGNIARLPFDTATYDVIVGWAILHHLTEADVVETIRECHRVLKAGGLVVFEEPVENSAVFDFIQNLFPAGQQGSPYYRPSILRRKAWASYVKAIDDRTMTSRELVAAGAGLFQNIRLSPYGLLIRLTRLFGNRHRESLLKLDRWLFKAFPPLRRYSQTVLVEYWKIG